MSILQVGDNAPKFKTTLHDGSTLDSKDLKGQKYILFFYPRDNTPGCTAEACNLRDNYNWFVDNGYQIYGVSPDTEKKHLKFIDKYDFPFPLISDPDKEVINAFGVWGPKKFMGKSFDGLLRTTFVIDGKGKIVVVINKVKTKTHTDQLQEALEG